MNSPERKEQLRYFFERVGMVFEQWGMPRMAGRILGWLMVCDPPRQTAAQLVEVLQASKGSISTNLRLLLQSGTIEKVGVPGERSAHYQLVSDPMSRLVEMELATIRTMRELVESGLALLEDRPLQQRERLEEFRAVWSFFEREFPKVVASYYRREESKEHTADKGGQP